MKELDEAQIKNREAVLKFLYQQRDTRNPPCFSNQEIAAATDLSISEVDSATRYLEEEKLLRRFSDQGVFGISHNGIKAYEQTSIKMSDAPFASTGSAMERISHRAFFIMPFGKKDLENVWRDVYDPVSRKLGFEPVRIDEKDDGRFKLDQIINEISTGADIIIGDLTYERPNCYFEIGYARAIRKEDEVLLCARRDHVNHTEYRPKIFSSDAPWSLTVSFRPKYLPPKVHFDLSAFDILTWDIGDLNGFKLKFEKRLSERVALIRARVSVSSSALTTAKTHTSPPTVDLTGIAAEFRRKLEDS